MKDGAPRFCVEHRVLAWFLVALALGWGAWSFTRLPRRKDPVVVVPVVAVVCPWPGAPAEDVEAQLATPLEHALAGVPGIETTVSTSRANLAALRVVVTDRRSDPAPVFAAVERAVREHVSLPPGAGPLRVLRDDGETAALLVAVEAKDRDVLDRAASSLRAALGRVPGTARVDEVGAGRPALVVDLDAERLLASGLPVRELIDAVAGEPMPLPGEAPDPATARVFHGERGAREATVGVSTKGPVHLAAIGTVRPETRVDFPVTGPAGDPAVLLAAFRTPGTDAGAYGHAIRDALGDERSAMPNDVRVTVLSDQADEVARSTDLFLESLAEAIALVVLVAWFGFREWRSALLLALSIPLTLALTFGLMWLLGVDLQQVSLASLILALGLLVDDPVVAGDAIRRELDAGVPRREAAWRGPVRLSRAILFATLTNVVAYLPLLLVGGNVGRFIRSLPLVLCASLIASRLVSMTFVPLAGALLLRRHAHVPHPGAAASRAIAWAVAHRRAALAAAVLLPLAGLALVPALAPQFFPRDLSTLSYVDVWSPGRVHPADAARALDRARTVIGQHAASASVATVPGRGVPRFWFSLEPAPPQARYGEAVIAARSPEATEAFVGPLQRALDREFAGTGVLADVRQLEIGTPVGVPVQVRVSGPDPLALERAALALHDVLAAVPGARGVRDDWDLRPPAGPPPPDLPGLPGSGERLAAAGMLGGIPLGIAVDGADRPVLLRIDEAARTRLAAALAAEAGPAAAAPEPSRAAIVHRGGVRTVTVSCFPKPGALPSAVLRAARPGVESLARRLPPGYGVAIGGEDEEQRRGFAQLGWVFALSTALIAVALAVQFRGAVQPLLVFAAIPFGVAGAVVALWLTGTPFGFMAFLGIASLVGVIVSHVIVLFDGVEDLRRRGTPLDEALAEAARSRVRPVLITVAATVLALVPLLWRGGPLWRPLCIAQIGGLTVATLVTLVLMPVLYVTAARDLEVL